LPVGGSEPLVFAGAATDLELVSLRARDLVNQCYGDLRKLPFAGQDLWGEDGVSHDARGVPAGTQTLLTVLNVVSKHLSPVGMKCC
jgi:hypothetical protein